MDKKKSEVLGVNADIIKAALRNAENIEEAAIEVAVVNPLNISLKSRIYAVSLKPITRSRSVKMRALPTLGQYASVQEVLVESLATGVKDGYVTVNGTINIPETDGKVMGIRDAYFGSPEDAREVARAITAINLERVRELKEILAAEEAMLVEQEKEDRF